MNRKVTRAFVVAIVLAAGLLIPPRSARAEGEGKTDPPGATCYHFPLITVCCDAGGCYIL